MESSLVRCSACGSHAGGVGAGADGCDSTSARAWIARQRRSAWSGEEFAWTRCRRERKICGEREEELGLCLCCSEEWDEHTDEGQEAELALDIDFDIDEEESCSISFATKKIACHR